MQEYTVNGDQVEAAQWNEDNYKDILTTLKVDPASIDENAADLNEWAQNQLETVLSKFNSPTEIDITTGSWVIFNPGTSKVTIAPDDVFQDLIHVV